MQFIKNGPDIPERLLQAHEEGRVVLFCGAGISYPAGLPGFKGLVHGLYDGLGMTPNLVQQAALKARQYDTAIGLLEIDHAGERAAVRRELATILALADTSPKATLSHEALLTLGQCRNGKLRLVTTNFDRLFQAVIERKGLKVNTCQAPLLPVPKNRWDGLVYLHGLLSPAPCDSELDLLVVSSGDFGLAYLIERWAARFVSELFRYYTVCFVGYSLTDPVLRYMMDALAADRQRGEPSHDMYAFGSYKKGKKTAYEAEWRAKNVTPILYQETKDHRYLHKTLQRWSETYRDGVRGKELIIAREAVVSPLKATQEDGFVGRVLWALSDEGGLPAKRFADMTPVPPLDWLEPLSEDRYEHGDLGRFGVPPKLNHDSKLTFSLTRRPAPYELAPLMAICDSGAAGSQWDAVMLHLARWLTRHIDDPDLILWLAKRGGQLHPHFARLLDSHLNELVKLERGGKTNALDRVRADAPRAIPRSQLRTIWRLMLSGRIRSQGQDFSLYQWKERLQRDGWSPSLRLALRELLSPCIELRVPIKLGMVASEEPQITKELVNWELKLRTGHVHTALRELSKSREWQAALPDLLTDFNLLLRDALDLMRELGDADDHSDHSYVHRPSISDDPQNRDFRDWTALIGLTRDAWLELSRISVESARLVAQQWRLTPYPLFIRLALFAAAQQSIIPPSLALDWLLADGGRWLWSVETQHEALQLLTILAPRLRPADLTRLEGDILAGPPRSMFRDDLDPQHWQEIADYEVWLRLAKVASTGTPLGETSQTRIATLSSKNPLWKLTEDKREEFPFWMGNGEEWGKQIATPRRRRELVEWLKQRLANESTQDDWQQRCRDDFATTACALYALSRENIWPVRRWREALQAWGDEKLLRRSWRCMAPVLAKAPVEVFDQLSHGLGWWLQTLARSFEGNDALFLDFCLRILSVNFEDDSDTDEPISRAINHPIGQVTEALLRWWHRRELQDDQGLPAELKPILTNLCDPQIPAYRHARVLLAAHVITLFRVDPNWAKQNLLPYFNWQRSPIDARSAWEGFLWSPRLYPPLLELLKASFLDTATHYAELADQGGHQYAALLTFTALEAPDTFTVAEVRAATQALPEAARVEAVRTLTRALESSGEQRAEYWRHRILPYWNSIWPKSRDYTTKVLAEPLALLCIAAHEAFPEAVQTLRPWLQPGEYADYVVHQLEEADLPHLYPERCLEFLNAVVNIQLHWPPHNLGNCLSAIESAEPNLREDVRFRRLTEYLEQRG